MKVMDCRLVQSQIEEAELGRSLSADLSAHVQGCQQCSTFLDERTKLRHLVASLGQVEAPPDFDFRLKARLASNERSRSYSFGKLLLGIPAAAVAALLIVVGTLFLIRQPEPISTSPVQALVRKEAPVVSSPSPTTPPSAGVLPSVQEPGQTRKRIAKPAVQFSASQRRPATREFSTVPAPVMKQDESLAALPEAFPIGSSPQSLKLSLDDGTGVYRTISVPRVSFGSQRAFGEQSAFVKTSSNGIW